MPRQRHELWVFLQGELIGRAVRSRRGSVHFSYELNRPVSATALALSLGPPTRGEAHGGNATYDISAWMDGLLPDNQHTRSRWSQTFGAGSTDPFDLLSTPAGLECAGAVQFCCEPTLPRTQDQLVHLSATDMETTLRLLREDAATDPESGTLTGFSDRPRPNGRENTAFRPELRTLRLSLPGAQPKMASKNYGILLSKYQHGFAPLYDLSSAAVYLPTGSVPDLAMIFDVPTNTYRQWSQAAAQLGVNVSIDHLIAMTRVLPDAFDTAVSQCPGWASDTATRVGERIVGYAQATTRRLTSRSGSAASAGSTLVSPLIHQRCGVTVKRTSRPCLLRKGHAGRHRSVL